MFLAALLPYSVVLGLGGAAGRLVYRILPKERRKMLEHLRLAFGSEKSETEIEAIALKTFEQYGFLLAEWIKVDYFITHLDEVVSTEGYGYLDQAFAKGKGIVLVGAHFGNWEFMGGHTSLKNYPCTAIARKIYFEKYDRLLTSMRRKMKVETIYRSDPPRRMLKALHQNRMVGFFVDQAVEDVDGIWVNFFGRPAWTPVAPVRFASASGAALICGFNIREGLQHRIIVEPPIELVDTGDKAADLRTNTQAWVDIQERYIRRYPHLWVWNHKRWKTV